MTALRECGAFTPTGAPLADVSRRGASSLRNWCRSCPAVVPLTAGAVAGMCVEAALFPLDCAKTRLQSGACCVGAGGVRGLYRGVGVTVACAGPASAVFFCTYETAQERLGSVVLASVAGEVAGSVVRVPADLVKQRLQMGITSSAVSTIRGLVAAPGSVIFASFRISAARDIFHSGLQYPLYERLKCALARHQACSTEELPVWQSAACGSAAGATSAWATTPLDLLRTRVNLLSAQGPGGVGAAPLSRVVGELLERGRGGAIRVLFAGAACRAAWMGLGGFVFLGSFETARRRIKAFVDGP